jgi:hypothetical protein
MNSEIKTVDFSSKLKCTKMVNQCRNQGHNMQHMLFHGNINSYKMYLHPWTPTAKERGEEERAGKERVRKVEMKGMKDGSARMALIYGNAKYKCISKACHCAVLHHLNDVETEPVANGNLGSFYKYTNRKLNGSNGIAPLRDGDGKIITSGTD